MNKRHVVSLTTGTANYQCMKACILTSGSVDKKLNFKWLISGFWNNYCKYLQGRVKNFTKFGYVQVCNACIMWQKQV